MMSITRGACGDVEYKGHIVTTYDAVDGTITVVYSDGTAGGVKPGFTSRARAIEWAKSEIDAREK